jgi:hypothetical protein
MQRAVAKCMRDVRCNVEVANVQDDSGKGLLISVVAWVEEQRGTDWLQLTGETEAGEQAGDEREPAEQVGAALELLVGVQLISASHGES